MQITEYVCDECGKKRSSDVNHWRTIYVHGRMPDSCLTAVDMIHGQRDDAYARVEVCGQDCAVKVFSRWLSTGRLKAEVPVGKS